MALQVAASIYGANQNDWNAPMGRSMAFPSQGILIQALPQPKAYSGVTCNTQIQLLPYGPSPIQPVFYSPLTVAALVTLANA